MEKKRTVIPQGFPVRGNATVFMVPFHYGEECEDLSSMQEEHNCVVHEYDNSLWTLETQMLTDEGDGSVIYPYIMSFLQGQMMDGEDKADGHLAIYSIADVDRRESQDGKFEQRTIIKKFWNKFVQSEHLIDVGTKMESRQLRFRFNNGKYKTLKPHIFIFPSARIGLLTYGIELITPNATTDDLKLLNYHLHKIARPVTKCVCLGLSVTEEQRDNKEAMYHEARKFIEEHVEKKKKKDIPEDDGPMEFTWNMRTFIHMMLKDVHGRPWFPNNIDEEKRGVELFTPPRIHLFTYCGIDDSQDLYTRESVLPELYRLSRCVNDKYLLPLEDANCRESVLQTFENVYVASTVEGTAFIALPKEQNVSFFENFISILALRYFWIYLLAMVQRYALLNMDRMLTVIEAYDAKYKLEKRLKKRAWKDSETKKHSQMLWRLLESIRKVKVRCHFTDVSPFTQHNEFYELCCNNLHVNNAFDEIDHKTKALNLTMSHDLQLLQDARENRLNLFLAILAALQALGVIYEFIDVLFVKNDWNASILYFILILISIGLICFMYKKQND